MAAGFNAAKAQAFNRMQAKPVTTPFLGGMTQQSRRFSTKMSATGADFASRRVAESLIKEPSAAEMAELNKLPTIELEDLEQVNYLATLGEGWAYPLNRFMNEQELLESMNMNTITDANGEKHILSVPIVLAVSEAQKEALANEKKIALKFSSLSNDVMAVIENPEFFPNRKEEIATKTFGTWSKNHQKVAKMQAEGDWLISGEKMHFTQRIKFNDGLDKYRLFPNEIQAIAKERGADAVYAFQVRNPLHNGHCLLLKDTREQLIKQGYKNPLLLLHPLGGWMKDDDVPLDYRMRQHQALLDDGTLNPEHTILSIWPSPMYYSGPNEVLWHCSSRVQCGITHFITGRDPAGVKHPEDDDEDLYDPWHGQKLLVSQKELLSGVDVVPFKIAAYNFKNKRMEFFGGPDSAPKEDFQFISGSKMRKLAAAGEEQPEGFMSPNGWKILCEYYQSKK